MRSSILLFIGLLALATWLGLWVHQDPGYALLSFQDWTIEMPMWLAVIGVMVLTLVLCLGIWLLNSLVKAPTFLRNWQKKQAKKAARDLTTRALLELAEGNWASAERLSLKGAKLSDVPLINYLTAAKAAQELNKDEHRNNYLRLADNSTKGADIAVGLTQAQLQYNHGQFEQSLATLKHLKRIAPKHNHVLKLLSTMYQQLEDWEQLLELIPCLKKNRVFSANELESITLRAYLGTLSKTAQQKGRQALIGAWQALPRFYRFHQVISRQYITLLCEVGADSEAEPLIRQHLKRHWDLELVRQYGLLSSDNIQKQINTAESWLRHHQSSTEVLLTLGRLCIKHQLWGKARDYLEASCAIEARPETLAELGKLLEELGEKDKSHEYYREGLLNLMSTQKLGTQSENESEPLIKIEQSRA